MGSLLTGGGAFDLAASCDDAGDNDPFGGGGLGRGVRELPRGLETGAASILPAAVERLGGGGGGVSFLCACAWDKSSMRLIRPNLAGSKAVGSYGGGSLRGAELDAEVDRRVEWLMCS